MAPDDTAIGAGDRAGDPAAASMAWLPRRRAAPGGGGHQARTAFALLLAIEELPEEEMRRAAHSGHRLLYEAAFFPDLEYTFKSTDSEARTAAAERRDGILRADRGRTRNAPPGSP